MSFCANCPHFDYEHSDMRRGEPCEVEDWQRDFGPDSVGFVLVGTCDCIGYEPEVMG